jgi:hypothetical protein
MDPRKAESMSMPYEQYRILERLSDHDNYVNPYRAETHGVEYKWWKAWVEDR